MKKNFLITAIACLISFAALSQAKPFYTQYILNNYILNPGITGIENYTDVKLSYRNQWAGINGAPVTSYFSIHGPLGKKDLRTSATSFQVPGENPAGKMAWDEYAVSPAHHGIGLTAINDKAGYINRWSIAANYAYHLPLTVRTSLAAGISAGVSSVTIDRTKIEFGSSSTTGNDDLAIGYNNGDLKKLKPEIGAGLWLYSARYFLGVSVLNIIPGKAKFVKNGDYGSSFTPNYFVTAGYRFAMTDAISVLPSAMLQYWQPQLTSIHANVKMQYEDLVWVGASYRFSDLVGGYSGMVGLNISNTFNISYAYEHATTSRLQTYTRGTHELVIGFLLGNKYGDSCPRNIW